MLSIARTGCQWRYLSKPFGPSSKTCSGCGHVKTDLTLADRIYECRSCGLVVDRDVNAAVNLARYTASRSTSSPPSVDA